MGAVVYGERLYGQVDRIPKVCYVSTLFWHVQYIPLFPVRSYLVIEGTEKQGAFRGKAISLAPKSVVVGLLRGWLGAMSIFCSIVASFAISAFFLGHADARALLAAFGLAGLVFLGVWYVVTARSWLFLPVQVALHAASLSLWVGYLLYVAPNPALVQAKAHELRYWPPLLVANLALLGYSLTRLGNKVSNQRGVEMITELGLLPEAAAQQ